MTSHRIQITLVLQHINLPECIRYGEVSPKTADQPSFGLLPEQQLILVVVTGEGGALGN